MRDDLFMPERTQVSHYLRTGRILPIDNFIDRKSIGLLAYKSWNTWDFWNHYKNGKGKPVNLANVGLFSEFRNSTSVSRSIDEYKERQILLATKKALKVCRKLERTEARSTHVIFSDQNNTTTDVTWKIWNLFSIGRSTFFRSAQTDLYIDCDDRTLHLEGEFKFSIDDAFIDARDLNNNIEGNQEFEGGTPFKIYVKWREKYGWKGVF